MNAFKESELCIKNVFFWDTFCSSSSKNERRGGDQFLQFLLNRLPCHSFIFCAILTYVFQKNTFFAHYSNYIRAFIVLPWKLEKNGISSIDLFYTGVLCTKTVNTNSDI